MWLDQARPGYPAFSLGFNHVQIIHVIRPPSPREAASRLVFPSYILPPSPRMVAIEFQAHGPSHLYFMRNHALSSPVAL